MCDATASACTNASWTTVSDWRIADDFSSKDYGGNSGDVGWVDGTGTPTRWVEDDPSGGGQSTSQGVVQTNTTGGTSSIQISPLSNSKATGSITRLLDLSGYSGTRMRASITAAQIDSTDTIEVQYSTNGTSWTSLTPSTAISNSTGSYTFDLPAAANTATTRIRFQLTANRSNEYIRINSVEIAPNGGLDSWCSYSPVSPVTLQPGFHCLGPQMNLTKGGSVINDTSGGSLSYYYADPTDSRGSTQTVSPFTTSSPLIATDRGATVQHVVCNIGGTASNPVLSNNCVTPVPESVFAPVGTPDRLNFFGRDTGNIQYLNIGSLASSNTAPGKISGAWFYFPQGDLTLTVDGCSTGATPSGFYTNDDGWNFSGRIWVKNFKPCGAFHFRVPPSTLFNTQALFGTVTYPGDVSFVEWSGFDWVARNVTSFSTY